VAILDRLGKENVLGSFLVGDLAFDYFMDTFFKGLVVGVSSHYVTQPASGFVFLVYELGL